MTTNRLAKSAAQPLKRSSQEWCDHGNAYLRGEVAGLNGQFIDKPRLDVHWVVKNGRATIEWVPKRPSFS